MADENKIVVEITLDDGSIQKGFINIEKNAEKLRNNLSKNGVVSSIKDEISGLAQSAPIIGKFVGAINPLTIAVGVAVGAFLALKKAIEGVFEGEKLLQIEKQFKSLADQAGVSSNRLATDFSKALGGLVDDSKAFEILNKSLVQLEVGASKLPDVMELARKATKVFGGEATANFELLSSAIANGSTKQLKQLGIVIDSEKVFKDYAKSIGTSAEFLTVAGKQQAILNEVLLKGGERFKGIVLDSDNATSSYAKLKVSINNLFDELSKASAAKGGLLSNAFDLAQKGVESLTQKLGPSTKTAKDYADEVENLKIKLSDLKSGLSQLQSQKTLLDPLTLDINRQNEAISKTTKQLEMANLAWEDARKNQLSFGASVKVSNEQLIKQKEFSEAQAKSANEYGERLRQAAIDNLQIQQTSTAFIVDEEERKNQLIKLKLAELDQVQQSAIIKLNEAETIKRQQGLNDEVLYQELLLQIINNYKLKRQAVLNTELDEQAKRAQQNIAQINSAFQQTLVKGISGGLERIGSSLVKGKSVFDDFGSFILGIFGDLAIQVGTIMIGMGIGLEQLKVSLATWNGAQLLAAGAALVVLGGALKSLSGGPGATSIGAGGNLGAGGASIAATPESSLLTGEQTVGNNRGTSLQVVIQGSVFDSQETGLRIANILKDSFEQQGLVTA